MHPHYVSYIAVTHVEDENLLFWILIFWLELFEAQQRTLIFHAML